jgi:hypothetical protein
MVCAANLARKINSLARNSKMHAAVIYYSIVSGAKRYFALQERDFPGETAAGLG